MVENTTKSSPALLFFTWLLVGVPLGWGVYNTLLSSMKLFQSVPSVTAAPTAPPK